MTPQALSLPVPPGSSDEAPARTATHGNCATPGSGGPEGDGGPITVDELRQRLTYDPVTGQLWHASGRRAGTVSDGGYVRVFVRGRCLRAHRVAFAMAHGRWPSSDLDHINGDKRDNRIENLREVTRTVSSQNRGPFTKRSTLPRGVFAVRSKFVARISIEGRRVYLGVFTDAATAGDAYERARAALHYGYARANHS